MTYHLVDMATLGQKPMVGAKGGRDFKVYPKEFWTMVKVLKEGCNAGRYE